MVLEWWSDKLTGISTDPDTDARLNRVTSVWYSDLLDLLTLTADLQEMASLAAEIADSCQSPDDTRVLFQIHLASEARRDENETAFRQIRRIVDSHVAAGACVYCSAKYAELFT